MSLSQQVKELVISSKTPLRMRDVMELTQFLIQHYIENKTMETDESHDEPIDVHEDEDGDTIDKDGYIYDVKERIRIGQKDLTTGKKVLYKTV